MSRRNEKFSRRALLKRLGVGAALLPILESEWASAAACSGTSGPRRALFIVWANGMLSKVSEWATAGTGTGFTLPPFMSSLEPYRNDLLLLDGITYSFINDSPNASGGETTGHACFQGMLTGALYKSFGSSTANNVAGGQSIDQYIGNSLKAKGYTGRTSLNTMVYSRSTARLSWTAAGSAIIPDDDPYNVYKTLFPGMTPVTAPPPAATPGTTPGATPPGPNPSPNPSPVTMPIDKMLMMRKSCMDFVLADLNRFSSIIGAADRVRVGAHLDAVRAIELQLSNQMAAAAANPTGGGGPAMGAGMPSGGVAPGIKPPPGMACMPPALPAAIATRDTKNFHTVTKMQIDLAVAALAADATRVVVLQLGDQGDPDIVFYNLGFKPAGTGDSTGDDNGYHEMAHQNTENKVTCDTWFQSQMAYAIGALKDVADADKTLLDNSVLVGMNNMRTGIHETRNVPVVMAGSCGGYFGTGRSLKLPSNTAHNNGLLIAVANALGVPTQTFGYANYGGELAGLKA